MAAPGIKYDDESGGFASNCFPVRFSRRIESDGGAWVISHQAEQRRRFKAVLCANPLTYDQIKQQRKRVEKGKGPLTQTFIIPPPSVDEDDLDEEEKILDGFFLMKHCCVEDPSDLCSVNVSGQGLVDIKEEDLALFDNVAYVNASDNLLPIEPLKAFPIIRELEISVNALRSLQISPGDFPYLEMLDVSFNNLSQEDILALGLLPALKILHLTGNGLINLPENMAYPYQPKNSKKVIPRYKKLEILLVEDNRLADLSIFAALAGLPNLRHLSLAKNELMGVPQLLVLDGRLITQELSTTEGSTKKSARSGRYTSRSSRKSTKSSKSSHHSKRKDSTTTPSIFIGNNVLAQKLHEDKEKVPENTETVPENKETVTENKDTDDTDAADNQDADQMEHKDFMAEIEELNKKLSEEAEDSPAESQKGSLVNPSDLPPPFPELIHLDISYNKIAYEESLLALAAWPMLSELIIHNNPLTTERTGDPPLLKTYLMQRLGIHIVRKKPGPLPKPPIEVKPVPENQVSSVVPKVPKRDVEDVIKAIKAAFTPALDGPSPIQELPKTAQDVTKETISPSPKSPERNPQPEPTTDDVQNTEEAFFMTQVEDQQEEKNPDGKGAIPKKMKSDQKASKKERKSKHKKGRNYDLLFQEDEDGDPTSDELQIPMDVNGKVRALQMMLDYPLQYSDNVVALDKQQAEFHPLYKKPSPPQKPRTTKQDQVRRVLTNLKERATVKEANLGEILQTKDRSSKREFPEAAKLLREVHNYYQ